MPKSSNNRQHRGLAAFLEHLRHISGSKVALGSISGRFRKGLGVHFGVIFRPNFDVFFDVFSGCFFNRFLIDSGPHFWSFFDSKTKSMQKGRILEKPCFSLVKSLIFEVWRVQIRAKFDTKSFLDSGSIFGSLFDRFWRRFGSHFGVQNQSKINAEI